MYYWINYNSIEMLPIKSINQIVSAECEKINRKHRHCLLIAKTEATRHLEMLHKVETWLYYCLHGETLHDTTTTVLDYCHCKLLFEVSVAILTCYKQSCLPNVNSTHQGIRANKISNIPYYL